MSHTIAIAGKGGVGKSTVSAVMLKALLDRKMTPVLVVDADPTANLKYYLGIESDTTVSDIRDSIRDKTPAGMSKNEYFNLKAQEILEERDGYDFIAMGHPEGSGCYCSVNNMLRQFLSALKKNYKVVLIDNEAGLEHLSRKTDDKVDSILFVSVPTLPGLSAVVEGLKITNRLKMGIGNKQLLLNYCSGRPDALLKKMPALAGLPIAGCIPYDPAIAALAESGKPVVSEISADTAIYRAVSSLLDRLLG